MLRTRRLRLAKMQAQKARRPIVSSVLVMSLLILSSFLVVAPSILQVHAVTVATLVFAGEKNNNDNGQQRETVWYDQGRYWVFFLDNASPKQLAYITSADGGSTWTSQTQITSRGSGFNGGWSTWLSGDTIYYATMSNSGDPTLNTIYMGKGSLHSDGTITWAILDNTHSSLHGGLFGRPSIFVSNTGVIFIPYVITHSGLQNVEIDSYSGSWSQTTVGSRTGIAGPIISQFRNNNLILTYISTDVWASESPNGGGTWSIPVEETTTQLDDTISGNQVTDGNVLHYAGTKSSDHSMWDFRYTSGSGAWSAGTSMGSGVTLGGPANGTQGLTIFQANGGGGCLCSRTSVDGGATWSGAATLIALTSVRALNVSPESVGEVPTVFATFQQGCTGGGGICDLWFVADSVVIPITGTTVAVSVCNWFQIQCWWYPLLFLGLFISGPIGVAAGARSSAKAILYITLVSLAFGSGIEVMMGIMDIVVPLLLTVVSAVYAWRIL